MPPSGPIDSDVLRRMRETITIAIATRSMSIAEAAAEARGLGRGLQPARPASTIADAVADLLRDLGIPLAAPEPVEFDGQALSAAPPEEVADALAHAMRFDERGKARRTGVEYVAQVAAEAQVRRLAQSGFVVLRRPGARPHTAGG